MKDREIPLIGYGTYPNKEKLIDAVEIAVNNGFSLIDTSDNYDNEEWVGKAIQKVDREKILVCSKFSQPYRTTDFRKCYEESEQKLGKIDIYLLHWPYSFLWKKQWQMMEKLVEEGKVSQIGVCNFGEKELKKLLKFCKVRPSYNQYECHPMLAQKSLGDFCNANGIKVMSYSPFARMKSELVEHELLKQLAAKYNCSVSCIILRWNIEHGYIPIPASVSEKHIIDNSECLKINLTEDEVKQIDGLDCGMRVRFNPATRFTKKEKFRFFLRRIKVCLCRI